MKKIKALIEGGIVIKEEHTLYATLHRYIYQTQNGTVHNFHVLKTDKGNYVRYPRNKKKFINSNDFYEEVEFEFIDNRIESDSISFELKGTFKLRDYQVKPVQKLLSQLRHSEMNSCLLQAEPGFGKTFILPAIVKALKQKTLVLVDRNLLRDQMYDEFTQNSEAKVTILESDTTEFGDVIITTFQMLLRNKHLVQLLKPLIGLVIVDECVSGDTEILTESGWVRFDELPKNIKVAQTNADGGDLEFVTPTKYIKRYSKDLVKITSNNGNGWSITATHGHRQPILDYNERLTTVNVGELPKSFKVHTTVDYIGGESDILSNHERLLIAGQADGYLEKTGIQFKLIKERKKLRLLKLLDGEDFITYKSINNSLRVYWKPKDKFSKNLWELFNITEFTKNKAKEFIEEMVNWDGSIMKNGGYYYSSTIKENRDFISAVATLAGYTVNESVQVDDRSDKYNDVFRLYINKNKKTMGIQKSIKEIIKHDDFVYCVSVPSTYIVIKQNGKVFITGNCHIAPAKEFSNIIHQFPAKYRLGLSATPTRSDGLTSIIYDTFGHDKVIGQNPDSLKVYNIVVNTEIPIYFNNKAEYAKKFVQALTSPLPNSKKGLTAIELAVESAIQLKAKGRKVFIYLTYRKLHALAKNLLEAAGYSVGVISSGTSAEKRDKMMADFQSGKLDFLVSGVILQKGVSIHALDTILNLSPQNKEGLEQTVGRLRREHSDKKTPMFIYFTFGGKMMFSNENKVDVLKRMSKNGDKFIRLSVEKFREKIK